MKGKRTMIGGSTWRRKISLVAVLAALCCSCGKHNGRKPAFPVQGRVLFEGKPLPHAFLVFHPADASDPKAVRPVASAGDDGAFVPTTYDADDGAPAGEYAVTIEWRRAPTDDRAAPGENLLSQRYSKPASTPFKVRIAEGKNELDPFQLKR